MKQFSALKKMGWVFLFLIGTATVVSAQGAHTLQAKQEHQQTIGVNYDIWKSAQMPEEVQPNKVLSTNVNNLYRTYLIQLGWNLRDVDAESAYETKLGAQSGVSAVNADFQSNTVEITVKEEDEYDILRTLFDIN